MPDYVGPPTIQDKTTTNSTQTAIIRFDSLDAYQLNPNLEQVYDPQYSYRTGGCPDDAV